MKSRLLGIVAATAALLLDQSFKLWMIYVFHIAARQPVRLAPFFDVVLTWNRGISYSLFTTHSFEGRVVLVAATLAATLALGLWMWRAQDSATCAGLGLIVGGALGNAIDRVAHGAVADFFYFHVGAFSWYIFNLADCAIVAGVALLLYEGLFARNKPRAETA